MNNKLRLYADFNSGGAPGQGACWNLRYGPNRVPLDEIAESLEAHDGMVVILFYEDPSEEFEVEAVLRREVGSEPEWSALPDWSRMRQVRAFLAE